MPGEDYGVCYSDVTVSYDYANYYADPSVAAAEQPAKPAVIGCDDGVDHDGDASCPAGYSGNDAGLTSSGPDQGPTINRATQTCDLPPNTCDIDDYDYSQDACTLSDEDYATVLDSDRKAACKDDAQASAKQCKDTYGADEPWKGHCDDAAAKKQAACEANEPPPACDQTAQSCEGDDVRACAHNAVETYDECMDTQRTFADALCDTDSKPLPGGVKAQSKEECMAIARDGVPERMNRQADSTGSAHTDSQATGETNGSSNAYSNKVGLSVGIASDEATYTHTDTHSTTKTKGTADTMSRSHTDTTGTKRGEATGYEASCRQQLERYKQQCLSTIRP